MLTFDPSNFGPERDRRMRLLQRFPATQRAQIQIGEAVDRLQKQYDKSKQYTPEFLAELDYIITQRGTLDRMHDDATRAINAGLTEALADGYLDPRDVGVGSGLGILPLIIAALASPKVIAVLVGGFVFLYVRKEIFDLIERLVSGQSELNARINAAKALSDAYAEFYRKNPNGTAPSPAELLKMFPPSPGGGVTAALNLGTVALVVGGLYLATKLVGGSKR